MTVNVHPGEQEIGAGYAHLRGDCGLIDMRGAGLFEVRGTGALDLIDRVCTRSVAFLLEGRTLAALMLREDGSLVCEVLLACEDDAYTVSVWPAQREAALQHLVAAAAGHDDVEVRDLSTEVATFAVEGPGSPLLLYPFLDTPVAELAYKHMLTTDWQGARLVVSRTGVTAEFGYQLRTRADLGDTLWARLVELGAAPVSMAAVNVCRLESRFVSYEDEAPRAGATPWELGVQSMVDFNHDFAGKQALLDMWESGAFREPVCFTTPARTLRPGDPVRVADHEIGRLTHALWSPGLQATVGVVHLERDFSAAGLDLLVQTGEEDVSIATCSAPFLLPTSLKQKQS